MGGGVTGLLYSLLMHPPGLWKALRADVPLRFAVLIGLAISVPYFFPLISLPLLANLARLAWEPLVLILVIAAIQYRLRGSETATGGLFWNYVSAALGFRFVAGCFAAVIPRVRGGVATELLIDSLFATCYLILTLATELRPDRGPEAQPREREEQLSLGSAVAFIAALLVYFAAIPALAAPGEYERGLLSLLLYLCLDGFLFIRFVYLARVASAPRWRLVYRLLGAGLGLSMVLLAVRYASLVAGGPAPAGARTRWDLVWLLPYLPILLAARLGRYAEPEAAAPAGRGPEPIRPPRAWEPLAFYAIAFPFLHLLFDFSGQLPDPGRTLQQALVIVYFVCFGALALVQSARRERRRRAAEKALRASEHRYRQLIETHPDAILIAQDDQVVYANAAGRARFGNAPSPSPEALGFPAPAGTDPSSAGEPVECRVTGADGKPLDLEVSYLATTYAGAPALQVIARDVTAVKKRRVEAERMERLASLGQFSAAMAHEIRNPLAAIVLRSSWLRDRLAGDEESLATLADLDLAVERMQRLVDGVLGFVRPGVAHKVEEDLQAIVDSALATLGARSRLGNVVITRDFAHRQAAVEVDVNQMLVVFNNLFDNALRAMPEGGVLAIRTENRSRSLRITVEDTGEGIAPEDLGRIFEPFFTRRKDGIGLGLALVARILEEHGCEVGVTSQSGEGTCFTLSFPLAASGDPPSEQ